MLPHTPRRLLVAVVLALLGLPATALAAGGAESFDGIAEGTVMREQVPGLKFGVPLPPGVPGGARPLVVRADAEARSGTKVAQLQPCAGRVCLPTRSFVHFEGPWPTVVRVWAGANGTSLLARLRAYDGRGRVIGEQEPQRVFVGAHTTELVLSLPQHIAYVEIEQLVDPRAANGTPVLTLDDFTWNDPVNPIPGFEGFVASSSNGPGPMNEPARVRAGRTFEWTVKLEELGGAYGRRKFTVTGLPLPESQVDVVEAVVTIDGQEPGMVTDDTELTVRATVFDDAVQARGSEDVETFKPVLVAEPVDPRAGASTVPTPLGELRVRPNVAPIGGVPGLQFGVCGAAEDTTSIGFKLPFADETGPGALKARRITVEPRITLTKEARDAGLSLAITPQRLVLDADAGPRGARFDVTARRTRAVAQRFDVPVVAELEDEQGRSLGENAALEAIPVLPDAVVPLRIDTVSPASGRTPQLLQPGTEVTISGDGFCPGAEVQFGNGEARVRADPNAQGALVARVPRLATTGVLRVLQGGQEVVWGPSDLSRKFPIDSFRNTQGYPFSNFNLDDLEFKDTVNLYGYEATHYDSIDFAVNGACELFTFTLGDCDAKLGTPDALALNHHFWTDLILAGDKPNNAHCFGMSVTSRQMLAGKVPLSKYGAKQIFDIAGPGNLKAGGIRRYLRSQHSAQLSAEFMHKVLGYFTNASSVDTTPEVVKEFKKFFEAGVAPVVSVSEGFSGHVVVAYDIEQVGDSWNVYVWDNNDPYVPLGGPKGLTPEDAPDGMEHRKQVNKGTIQLFPNGRWSYKALGYGGEYDGSEARLMVFDGAKLKLQPTIPTSLEGLMTVVFGGTATTDSAPGRKGVPFTTLDGNPVSAAVFTKSSKPLVRTIRPRRTKGGRYGSYVAGQGFSASLAAEGASVRDRDTLELDPRAGRVRLRTTARRRSFGLVAAREAGDGSRGLRVIGRTARGAVTEVTIDKSGTARIRAGAATRLKLTLVGAGKGDGSVRKLPAVAVKRGAVVRIDPTSWTDVRKAVVVRTKQPGRAAVTKRLKAVRR